ncbi:MAG: phosphopantetheine-binding protein [Chitinophagaceae bacterium]
MIAEIWEEVLAVEKVGMKNNFFELGGHSLVILKLASKIRKLGLKIDVKDFLNIKQLNSSQILLKLLSNYWKQQVKENL